MEEANASTFKAKCLGLLDEVAESGKSYLIYKRGKPVARLVPTSQPEGGYSQQRLAGTVIIVGDVLEPAVAFDAWEAERGVH